MCVCMYVYTCLWKHRNFFFYYILATDRKNYVCSIRMISNNCADLGCKTRTELAFISFIQHTHTYVVLLRHLTLKYETCLSVSYMHTHTHACNECMKYKNRRMKFTQTRTRSTWIEEGTECGHVATFIPTISFYFIQRHAHVVVSCRISEIRGV